jgi:hypothetical protein
MTKSLLTIGSVLFCSLVATAQAPTGVTARYLLDNHALDNSGNSYNGTLTNTALAANRFNNAGKATSFTLGSSTGQLPNALQLRIQNDFTVNFWFRTSMTARTGGSWYNGNPLIDAEVCGGVNDWGISLIDGGKVCMGIGPSDVTIKSIANYNDNNWHFVTATRTRTTGLITLYVDGVQVASNTASTGALTSPPFIYLGRSNCDVPPAYTGLLDELTFYDRALTGTEATQFYNYSRLFALPLQWVAFTGQAQNNSVVLNWKVAAMVDNAAFEVEQSTDSRFFTKIGTVTPHDAITDYSFTTTGLQAGKYYYRIKQVDIDGKSSFSKTIAVDIKGGAGQLSLQTNPATSMLVVKNTQDSPVEELTIVDLTGRIIKREKKNTTASVIETNIETLTGGYYILKITTKQQQVSLPFIKR